MESLSSPFSTRDSFGELIAMFSWFSVDSGGHVTRMTDTDNFRAASDMQIEVTSVTEDFKAHVPEMTTLVIPDLQTETVLETRETRGGEAVPGVSTGTMMVVGSVISCCVVLALLAAAILRHRKRRNKRHDANERKTPEDPTDKGIYAEIETRRCCCLFGRDSYSMRSRDHVDNIYAEVSDIIPNTPKPAKPGREVIYETLDGKDWSRSRSKSQGANDKPRCNIPPKIYDHLSFLELERLRREAGEPVGERRAVSKSDPVQISAGYDHLDRSHSSQSQSDDPDGNNNSLIRRLSEKQIVKKLLVVEVDRPRRGVSPRHDYFEIEKLRGDQIAGSQSSDVDIVPSMNSHEYFSLEEMCEKVERRRQKPPVPRRTCSLISNNGRCVSYPCPPGKTSGETGRRIRSYPEPYQEPRKDLNCTGSISIISSAVSSEGVYNIKTGHAQRFSSDGRGSGMEENIRGVRNDYFVLDPVFVSNDSTMASLSTSDDNRLHSDQDDTKDNMAGDETCPNPSRVRHDYFVLEAEDKCKLNTKPRFRIVEDGSSPSLSYRRFARQLSEPYKRSSGGVTVVKLVKDQPSADLSEENVYDRIRFQSVSEAKKPDFRPRVLSTPTHIEL